MSMLLPPPPIEYNNNNISCNKAWAQKLAVLGVKLTDFGVTDDGFPISLQTTLSEPKRDTVLPIDIVGQGSWANREPPLNTLLRRWSIYYI